MTFTSKSEETKVNRVAQHARKSYRGVAAAFAVVGVVVLSAGVAQGDTTHLPLLALPEVPKVGPHGETVAKPGPLGRMQSMTVDSGHLWVAEGGDSEPSRIDEFDATTGAFLFQPQASSEATYGEGSGAGIAVARSFAEPTLYVGSRHAGVPTVSVIDETGVLKKNWTGAGTPDGSFGGEVTDLAVDNSSDPLDAGRGNVYVAIASKGIVYVFHPETNGEEHYVGQITGTSPSAPFAFPFKLAVDEVTGELVVEGGVVRETAAVDVFKPSGTGAFEFVRTISGPPPSGAFNQIWTLAVDGSSGDIYVTEFPKEGPYRIDQFSSTGSYLGQIEDVSLLDPFAIAVDPESPHDLYVNKEVYGPSIVIPDVTTEAFSDLKPTTVTLNGAVNPDGGGEATCEFLWGTSPSELAKTAECEGPGSKATPVPNGTSDVSVRASLSGIERNVTYYYRLRATNTNGTNLGRPSQNRQFSSPGVILREASVSGVGPTSASFNATIDPGATATSYYFQYGTSSAYGQDAPEPPGEAIGSGTTDVQIPSLAIHGLSPGTAYHYRVVAVSEIAPGDIETVDGEDRTFTTQAAHGSFALADGRQWEMVSQPQKLGALIEGAGFFERLVQASAKGDAIAYRASSPTESEPHGGFANAETVLSARGAGGWSSRDISSSHDHTVSVSEARGNEFQIFSEDLSRAAVQPTDISRTLLSPEASEATAYLRSDFLGASLEDICTSSCYRPLVTGEAGFANVPPGTVFGEEPHGRCEAGTCGPRFQGASPDLGHIVLSSPVQLTATPAPAGGPGLYEWSEGNLQLLDLLPHGEEGPAVLAGTGEGSQLGVRHSISDDGEHVILEHVVQEAEAGNPHATGLYLRDVAAGETIRLDLPQGGGVSSGRVSYMDANSEGSRIFFLDNGRLMADSSPSGEDLYEYNLNAPAGSHLTDLSVDPHAGQSADVQMMLGASEDGSYAYFAASGALASGAAGGACCNLYVRHEGVTQLIAALPGSDSYDWSRALPNENIAGGLFARVSPNGRWLAFMSQAELTGYDTHDAVSGQQDDEVYLYHMSAGIEQAGALICASCDPTAAQPVGELEGQKKVEDKGAFGSQWVSGSVVRWTGFPDPLEYGGSLATHQPRYLSDSGRLFFDSTDALVPQDVDGVEDVYEYEPEGAPMGEHACSSASTSGSVVFKPAQRFEVEGRVGEESAGCVGLISSGTSSERSWFLDASESGGDVFFITAARLAPQDAGTADDVYDAHECTAVSPCSPVVTPPPPCETEASCKAAPEPQPSLYGAPSSATFSGAGNIVPPPSPPSVKVAVKRKPAKCPKGKTRNRHNQCAKAKKKKQKAKAKKSVHSDRRASR